MNGEVIRILEQKNVKPTPMRMLVLEQLLLQRQNLTLTEMERLLFPADRVTIYRTVQTFVKYGITHSIETINKGVCYALCSDNCSGIIHRDNHPHFHCVKCNQIICCDDFMYSVKETKKTDFKIETI